MGGRAARWHLMSGYRIYRKKYIIINLYSNNAICYKILCDLIIDELNVYQGSCSQYDDLTLVAIKSSHRVPTKKKTK